MNSGSTSGIPKDQASISVFLHGLKTPSLGNHRHLVLALIQ